MKVDNALWFRTTNVGTEPLTHSFAALHALLTHSLTLHYSLCSLAHSIPRSWGSVTLDSGTSGCFEPYCNDNNSVKLRFIDLIPNFSEPQQQHSNFHSNFQKEKKSKRVMDAKQELIGQNSFADKIIYIMVATQITYQGPDSKFFRHIG